MWMNWRSTHEVKLVMQESDGDIPINKLSPKALNGKTNEVASKEDLVFALRNMSKVNTLALA